MSGTLRKVNPKDCALLFEWVNDSDVRENALNNQKINWEEHKLWFSSKINDPSSKIFIFENDNTPVGQIRFDRKLDGIWDIDYSISKKYRGRGFGKEIVKLSLAEIEGTIRAIVKRKNVASGKVFEKLGFKIVKSDEEIIEYNYR